MDELTYFLRRTRFGLRLGNRPPSAFSNRRFRNSRKPQNISWRRKSGLASKRHRYGDIIAPDRHTQQSGIITVWQNL
jgi:hypothetical protein